jgi:hypothetical protein
VKSKQRVLHPTELGLNSELTSANNQSIADVDHRFDLQPEVGEFGPEAIEIDVKALGI